MPIINREELAEVQLTDEELKNLIRNGFQKEDFDMYI
jgi:hypothetical protein